MGKDEKVLLDIARRQNGPVSERIQNAPDLLPGLQLYVDAFNLLSRSRPIGQSGLGSIPYSEISLFCEYENIHGEDREDLFYLVGEMDRFFIEFQSKKIQASAKSKQPATPQVRRPQPTRRTR